MPSPPLPAVDLDHILSATASLWSELRGQRLFLSGGTGFFGCWLVESFLHINRALALNAQLTVLTRDPEGFLARLPHLRAQPALSLLQGDVRTFTFPPQPHAFVVHAATAASAQQLAEHPHRMLSTILSGTERILSFAAAAGSRKLLFTSSGAIYGRQPTSMLHLAEDYPGAPDPLVPASTYAEGKRVAELLCAQAATPSFEIKIARCFAFLGPHLPLHTHFAAGNFLADALAGRNLHIASDGSSIRSYLYASDLAIWLWTILFAAPSLRAFNVGSSRPVTIAELAETIRDEIAPTLSIEIAQPPQPGPAHRYVPSTDRVENELNLRQTVSLAEAIRRTAHWHQLKSTQ